MELNLNTDELWNAQQVLDFFCADANLNVVNNENRATTHFADNINYKSIHTGGLDEKENSKAPTTVTRSSAPETLN